MTKLQAHRGVSYEYPENTMIAYQAAIDQGYGIIELDPKYTADGKIVMLHDKSIKRTARDEHGEQHDIQITELTLAEAQGYEYGSWKGEKFKGEKMPTLADVLDFSEKNKATPIKLDNVWNKFPDDIRARFLSEVAERGDRVNVGFTCSTPEALAEAATTNPLAALHYDGIDVSEESLRKISEIANGHKLVIWLCYDTPATKWYKGERASVELCERVRKYGEIGIWLLAEREELREAIVDFKADYVETNGKLKPWWIDEISKNA